jgi:hypothetical protein
MSSARHAWWHGAALREVFDRRNVYDVNYHTIYFRVKRWIISHQADIPKVKNVCFANEVSESVNVLLQGHPVRNQRSMQWKTVSSILPHVIISTRWAQANRNSLIAPDGYELLQNFKAKAGTIFNGATIRIGALVRCGVQKLMNEESTCGMNYGMQ